ncbi:MAG: FixH family protein [Bacteroidota bacterium]
MKMNWGTYLVLAMIGFIGFIMFFVVQMMSSDNNQDLVEEGYYQKELLVQGEIDKTKNAFALSEQVQIKKTKDGVLITFPSELQEVSGTVLLYRPSNKKLDFEMPIKINQHKQLIAAEKLVKGRWNVYLDFTDGEKEYAVKKEIIW